MQLFFSEKYKIIELKLVVNEITLSKALELEEKILAWWEIGKSLRGINHENQ